MFIIVEATKDQTTVTLARILMKCIAASFGKLHMTLTNHEMQFERGLLRELCLLLLTGIIMTSSFYPQMNVFSELEHLNINSSLRALISHEREWKDKLSVFVLRHSATVNDSIGETPHSLTFWREPSYQWMF